MSDNRPFVSIIIVNYNGSRLLKDCLDSLAVIDYPKNCFEIIVVDNRSKDDSLELLRGAYKKVKIIENQENNYCKACNLGITTSSADYVVLLNNDVRVKQDWLSELVETVEKDDSIGAVTGKLLNDDGTIQNAGLLEFPDFYWEERGAGREGAEFNEIAEIDAISGACVLFRKTALEQVGLLDEDFVMFGEDVDMCLRLKKEGWKLVFVPSSMAYHKLHGSCTESFAREAIERNRLLLIAKHFPQKISNALSGSGFFSVQGKSKESGQLFDLVPKLFLKLIREHDAELAQDCMKEVIAELKRTVNFDAKKLEEDLRNTLEDLNETRKDRDHCKSDNVLLGTELNNLHRELTNYKEEIDNLTGKLKNSMDSGLAKDSAINQLQAEFNRYREDASGLVESYKDEINNLANKLKESLDSGLIKDNAVNQLQAEFNRLKEEFSRYRQETCDTLDNYKDEINNLANKLKESLDSGLVKDNTISQLNQELANYKDEVTNLANKLQESLEARLKLEAELSRIYASGGFRFILRPLWGILKFSSSFSKFLIHRIGDLVSLSISFVMAPIILWQLFLYYLERLIEIPFGWFSVFLRKERAVVSFDNLTVSVVIPNWNGIDYLRKCLASIFEADGFNNGRYEVLVVDDCSDYDIAKAIKDDFPNARVIRNARNQGFGRSCNIGVRQAQGELIILLNNDIMVSKEFLEPLKRHFKDEGVFAVAPKLYYWDKKTFNYGMQMGRFRNGYLSLWNEAETGNGDRVSQAAPTIFAIGGAAAFRKKDFIWLGGFDDIYRPNCWEDIDISYRAQKRGLKVLYEPGSLVYHKGAATLNYVRHKEIKNELLFMWKNITDSAMLLSHFSRLPGLFFRGKHSGRRTFLRGYLWALGYFHAALINRLSDSIYVNTRDKTILNRTMLYYRNLMRNNYIHTEKKTVLLITPFMLHPLDCGGKIRICNIYKRLSKKYNLILLSLIHSEKEREYAPFLEDIFKEIFLVHTKTPSNELLFPGNYKYSFSSHLIDKLKEIQDKFPIDSVHIESNELLYLARHVKYIPVVYTEHDISILSYHNSYYHKGLRSSLLGLIDYLKLICYHNSAYRYIDHVVVLSREDREVVRAFSPQTDCSLVATGVDLKHFVFSQKDAKSKTLIFVGHYPHYPNEEAAVYFCRQILPLIRKELPDVTLKLVGSSPTQEVVRLSGIEGVELIGAVPDVNPYLQEASVFVTPFRKSSGIRGKVLEAMATGTPVVCTRRGAFGINAINGKDILIADTPEEFARRVIELLTDRELYAKIALNARKLVEENYDWDKIVGQLDAVYGNAAPASIDEDRQNKVNSILVSEADGRSLDAEDKLLVKDIIERVDGIIGSSLKRLALESKKRDSSSPEELHIELTHACNSRCITCDIWDYHRRNNKSVNDELSLDELGRLIKDAKYLKDIKTVVLSGGEPFLRKDIVDICGLINKLLPQTMVGILTNGLDTENVISKAKAISAILKPGSFWIGSSIDGIGETYDRIRGVKGGFERFVRTVESFKKELPAVKFSTTFVLTPLNIDDLVPCWEFANKNGLDFFAQFGVRKQARDAEIFNWKEEELAGIRERILYIIHKLITQNAKLTEFSDSLSVASDKINLLTKIYYWAHLVDFQRSGERFFHKCDAAYKFAMLDPYGNLFFCPLLKEKTAGNIRERGFDDLWRSQDADKIRNFVDGGRCSCWLVCTVFPIADKALSLFGDEAASAIHKKDSALGLKSANKESQNDRVILGSGPKGVTIGANYKCNADCMFCLGGEYKPFSLQLYKDYFEPKLSVLLNNSEYVSFCGMGELLLTKDAGEFLDHINTTLPNQNKILTTNGLALNESILNRITSGRYSIQVSLHASNSGLHKHLTGIDAGFDRIIKQIRQIISKRENRQSPYVCLVFLVNTLNIEDLPNFVELASSLGVDSVQCNYLTIFKDAHLKLSCFFKQETTNKIFDKAKARAEELNIPLVLPPKFSSNGNGYFKAVCREPWKNIYVDTEGAVLPCCYSGEHFGELGEADILSIWNNEKFQQLRNGLLSGKNEGICRYCLNCDSANVDLLNAHVSFRPDVQKEIFK